MRGKSLPEGERLIEGVSWFAALSSPFGRAVLALVCTAFSCLATYVLMLIVFILLGWGGSANGSRNFLVMTSLFSLAGWLLIFLPLVLFVNPSSRLFRRAVFPWVGAAGAVLVFC